MTETEVEAWRARQDEKAAKLRRFTELDKAAYEARVNPKKAAKVAAPKKTRTRRVIVRAASSGISSRPDDCVTCGRPMRASGAPPEEGTVKYGGRGLCATCWSRPYSAERLPMPEACHDCGRPLRHTDQRLEDFPGTLKHVGNGLCKMCENRRGRGPLLGTRVNSAPTNCRGCERPLRNTSQSAAEKPGSVRHMSQGFCAPCVKVRKRAGTWVPKALVS